MNALAPVALVINPHATLAGRRERAAITRALSPLGLEWSLTTSGPGDGGRLARIAADEGARLVVTLGGDGTAAEAAGALAGGPTVLAPMPGGNANVFARALGWPARAAQAAPALVAAAERAEIRVAHLGRLTFADGTERIFTINAGMGLDAAAVEWIEAHPATKRRLRHLGFAVATAVAAASARRQGAVWLAVGGEEELATVGVLVACGSPYTYLVGRALDLAPGAEFDGRLAWTAIERARLHELAGVVVRAARGRPVPDRTRALSRGAGDRELCLRAERPAPVQADGEPLGRHERVRVSPGPELRVLDPR